MLRPRDRHRIGLPRLGALLVFLTLALAVGGHLSWADGQLSPRHTPVVRAVQQARPSVVNIQGRKTVRSDTPDPHGVDPFRQVNGMGTGIIIDDRGYILTNYHVVENVDRIQVTLADRREFVAEFIAHDPATDLAIIKIEDSRPLTVIRFGISSDLMPGEPVIAVGNAFGYEHTVTCGIISALHREVQVSATQEYHDLIQTDASINPGNSGGPLIELETGNVIGIITRAVTGIVEKEFDNLISTLRQNQKILEQTGAVIQVGGVDPIQGLKASQAAMEQIAKNLKRSANVGIGYAFSIDRVKSDIK